MSKIVYEVTVDNDNDHTYWRLNGEYHREDGPACEYSGGTKFWYVNGKLHRSDGPACEYAHGYKSWYINGVNYTEEDFNKKISEMHPPAAQSCAGKVVEIEGKRYQLVEVTSV